MQQLKELADTLTEEQANIVNQVIMQFERVYAILDKWEKQAIEEWEAMSEEERLEGMETYTEEELRKEFGLQRE